jgi:Flp pilus assembly protein TadG
MHVSTKRFIALARAFLRARRGNVAMMFGLAAVPMMIAAGVGLDYARAMLVRQQMSEALDAAALAVGSSTGLDHDSAQTLAQKYFNANFTVDSTAFGTPTVTIPSTGYSSTGSVVINATDTMPTVLVKLVGINSLAISTSSTVVWGQSKLWVALVLDNSGSMSQGDSSGTKMTALKNASHQLLTTLQNASSTAGDVQVSIVPFDRHINIGTSHVNDSWIDWTDWEAPPTYPGTNMSYGIDNPNSSSPATVSFEAWGPGDDCPFTTGAYNYSRRSPYGFYCISSPSNSASRAYTIPNSGTYKGYICPGIDSGDYGNSAHRDRYYNGCYTSTKVSGSTIIVSSGWGATCTGFSSGFGGNCSCSGSGSGTVCKTQKWSHAWVANAHSTWSGCIMDRDKTYDYDISNTTPDTTAKGFPAANPSDCLSATVTPLSYNWTSLGTQIDNMVPNISTNQAIGIAHGWQTLTNSTPYSPGAVPANTARYIILLSDGKNTQDRWWGDGSTEGTTEDGYIDAREKATCDAAKADGITIYTIFLDIGGANGDSAPLQYCASDSSKYFDLTTTTGVVSTFTQIAQQITNVRVSR